MCLIYYKPKGLTLRDTFTCEDWGTATAIHGDGIGIYYPSDYETIKHTPTPLGVASTRLWASLQGVREELCIHFRAATHGTIHDSNTHPFTCKDTGLILMHNGVIPWLGSKKNSDTAELFEILKQLSDPSLMLSRLAHIGNKFLIHKPNKAVRMFGEFIPKNGAYFSNDWHMCDLKAFNWDDKDFYGVDLPYKWREQPKKIKQVK